MTAGEEARASDGGREILEFMDYVAQDERLESRVVVERGAEAPVRLRPLHKRGVSRPRLDPLECDPAALRALIDGGLLAFEDAWLTITPAGKAALLPAPLEE